MPDWVSNKEPAQRGFFCACSTPRTRANRSRIPTRGARLFFRPNWPVHLRGEAACAYLLEAVKDGAGTRFQGSPVEAIIAQATPCLPTHISVRHSATPSSAPLNQLHGQNLDAL